MEKYGVSAENYDSAVSGMQKHAMDATRINPGMMGKSATSGTAAEMQAISQLEKPAGVRAHNPHVYDVEI